MNKGDYRDLFDLSGKVAVVTGGIGILGKCFCKGLAEFGASVAVVDLGNDETTNFAEELSGIYGVRCTGVGADVSEQLSVKNMVSLVESELGTIDVLLNNAASKGDDLNRFFDSVEDFSLDTWRKIMSVNLDGMFLVAREAGMRMATRGHGSIIQTASIYGLMGPDQRIYEGSSYMGRSINTPPVYSASKSGVIGLTKYLATYWANKGIRVNSLTPGGIESGQNELFRSRYSNRVPMNRMAQPDEIVGALIFLASDASSYITGQNIVVDGGLSAW